MNNIFRPRRISKQTILPAYNTIPKSPYPQWEHALKKDEVRSNWVFSSHQRKAGPRTLPSPKYKDTPKGYSEIMAVTNNRRKKKIENIELGPNKSTHTKLIENRFQVNIASKSKVLVLKYSKE